MSFSEFSLQIKLINNGDDLLDEFNIFIFLDSVDMNSFLKLGNVKFYFITIFEMLNTICNMPVITELYFSQLKVVEAKVILILKSMSERGGSEIERLLILMPSNSIDLDPTISVPDNFAISIITVSH